jgi:hypothetical protein
MEKIKGFLTEIFKTKISEQIYLKYINYSTNLIVSERFVNFEYIIGDTLKIMKERICEKLNIDDEIIEYKILIKRYNKIFEYNAEKNMQFEKYDLIILEAY